MGAAEGAGITRAFSVAAAERLCRPWPRLTPAELMSRGIVRGIIRPPAATASVAGQAADPR